ncbi:AbrB/MazE/SpoVT family DNA-binding domain-containing protein [Dyadobacter sp. CY261]|uniref:AbrB/MazE/SpoVT family DNA-binding domain-containing protein n=1 Tax=Dyadobacter sp. CY261 TaxID=2907203 RepID=UPI001F279F2A|nr:AbrB/MazE/SpoVT family DNA-binding domain-containing protein [Dyadobacter sp. CY261]MCF0070054.1 AbrB/MazE/SpoVT family DNA-binding domain-containing protein [Dyadobacter sp. CY261]
MLTKIRRIGNSRGILLSKTMLDQVDIDEYVDVEVKGNAIVIIPASNNPREGWADRFRSEDSNTDEDLLGDLANAFDDSEWEW